MLGEAMGEATTRSLDLLKIYEHLCLPRVIEEKMLRLIRQGHISKWFSGYGQEAVAVGCTLALERRDYVLPMHRNTGVWTVRGVPLRPLFCQLMGRSGGFTKGRDRSYHFGLPDRRIIGMISHVAAMLPVACGLGLASQLRGGDFVALCFAGDGATREGDFHEALSLAGVWRLPVVFVVENNGYGLSTPVEEVIPVADIAEAAAGYGMPGEVVDGNDVLAVMRAVEEAAERARSGAGPSLLEMKTFRMRGHEEASGVAYVSQERFEAWEGRDPLHLLSRRILEETDVEEGELAAIRLRLSAEVEEHATSALAQPQQESTLAAERADVFAPGPVAGWNAPVPEVGRNVSVPMAGRNVSMGNRKGSGIATAGTMHRETVADRKMSGGATTKRYLDAVAEGLWQAMDGDETVLLLGQDIAGYGGVFKVTAGFLERFGAERVRNTPIVESGAVGACMGLALEGFRPVLEIQYADFISCGFNQIVNNLATTHYRWGAPLPVTIRAPIGGGIGAGPFHSQSNEAWFCHVPGLKVVLPATPRDAKGLLMRAIRDPNPVLFFEHKRLYRSCKGAVPDEPYEIELGRARRIREGVTATIVTYGMGVRWAVEAAERWAREGAEIEVIDLRTLVPWDRDAVLASVRKTGRVLVLQEAPRQGGFAAEIAAQIAEEGFGWLDAPPVRVGAEDMPIPFSIHLEETLYSAYGKLDEALRDLLEY